MSQRFLSFYLYSKCFVETTKVCYLLFLKGFNGAGVLSLIFHLILPSGRQRTARRGVRLFFQIIRWQSCAALAANAILNSVFTCCSFRRAGKVRAALFQQIQSAIGFLLFFESQILIKLFAITHMQHKDRDLTAAAPLWRHCAFLDPGTVQRCQRNIFCARRKGGKIQSFFTNSEHPEFYRCLIIRFQIRLRLGTDDIQVFRFADDGAAVLVHFIANMNRTGGKTIILLSFIC